MLIHEIVEFCNNEYRHSDTMNICKDCNHPTECSGGCKKCLEQVHYPGRSSYGKKDYDCENMINFYVCDYTNKYASEMLYLLRKSKMLREIDEYHILSIGCGAAPDLMAFEQYISEMRINKRISYLGIDKNQLWRTIHNEIIEYNSNIIKKTHFRYGDAIAHLKYNPIFDANVIVLQYVISHFYNTRQIGVINHFFLDLIENVIENRNYDDPFVILINDVNSCYRGRNCFQEFANIIEDHEFEIQYKPYYFDYRIQNDFQRYGERHPSNNTLFDFYGIDLDIYEPWVNCSSAQMLIEID